jgi:hypothetical protein
LNKKKLREESQNISSDGDKIYHHSTINLKAPVNMKKEERNNSLNSYMLKEEQDLDNKILNKNKKPLLTFTDEKNQQSSAALGQKSNSLINDIISSQNKTPINQKFVELNNETMINPNKYKTQIIESNKNISNYPNMKSLFDTDPNLVKALQKKIQVKNIHSQYQETNQNKNLIRIKNELSNNNNYQMVNFNNAINKNLLNIMNQNNNINNCNNFLTPAQQQINIVNQFNGMNSNGNNQIKVINKNGMNIQSQNLNLNQNLQNVHINVPHQMNNMNNNPINQNNNKIIFPNPINSANHPVVINAQNKNQILSSNFMHLLSKNYLESKQLSLAHVKILNPVYRNSIIPVVPEVFSKK